MASFVLRDARDVSFLLHCYVGFDAQSLPHRYQPVIPSSVFDAGLLHIRQNVSSSSITEDSAVSASSIRALDLRYRTSPESCQTSVSPGAPRSTQATICGVPRTLDGLHSLIHDEASCPSLPLKLT